MFSSNAQSLTIRSNLDHVVQRKDAACRQAGRNPNEVRLVGVTKYVDESLARILCTAGCFDLAESRPQRIWKMAESLADFSALQWHLIGHLQRNKVRRTLESVSLSHTVDSQELIDSIEFESKRRNQTTHLLIEVNLSGDPARTGCMMSDTPRLVEFAQSKPHCCVKGLMGMAGISEDIGAARRDFSRLRVERDRIAGTNTAQLPELSMGMTADFEDAILEGATIVRIGSALWQGVLKQGSHD